LSLVDVQCCQVKENQEEINHEEREEHEEKERNFNPHLRDLSALRGEKFLIVQHWSTLGDTGKLYLIINI